MFLKTKLTLNKCRVKQDFRFLTCARSLSARGGSRFALEEVGRQLEVFCSSRLISLDFVTCTRTSPPEQVGYLRL